MEPAALDRLATVVRERLLAEAGEDPGTAASGEARIRSLVDREAAVLDSSTRTAIVERVLERSFGLGVLEPLLRDPTREQVLDTMARLAGASGPAGPR